MVASRKVHELHRCIVATAQSDASTPVALVAGYLPSGRPLVKLISNSLVAGIISWALLPGLVRLMSGATREATYEATSYS